MEIHLKMQIIHMKFKIFRMELKIFISANLNKVRSTCVEKEEKKRNHVTVMIYFIRKMN